MEKYKFLSIINQLTGSVYISKDIKQEKGDLILHISDTPDSFFLCLRNVIRNVKPKYIIHTGDFVDNIKLGISYSRVENYKKSIMELIKILESSDASYIYLSPGNHDDVQIVKLTAKRCIILDKVSNVNIQGLDIAISHYPQEILLNSKNYNLFGHDLSIKSKIEGGKTFLNGITSINIIAINSGNIYRLPYPMGTDEMRLLKGRVGF